MSTNTPPLRPMTAGDILDRAIRIYRDNFVALVSIVAVISVPLLLIQVLGAGLALALGEDTGPNSFEDPFSMMTLGSTQVLGYFIGAVGGIFQGAALAVFVSERFLGRTITLRRAYARTFERWLALLLAAILIVLANSLLVIAFTLAFVLPVVAAPALGTGGGEAALIGTAVICLCVLLVPAVLFSIYINTRWIFYTQAIVLEDYNSTGGLGRSWKLVRGSFWRVFGFSIILAIIVWIFSIGPILLVQATTILLASTALTAIVNSVASAAILLIMTPIQFATLTVLYYDLRIRKEGFDLEMRLRADPASSPDLPSLIPGAADSQ